MGNSSSQNNVKQVNLKKINSLKEQNQSDKRDSLSIVSTGNTSQFSSPAGDVQRFGNVLPLNEPPYNVQGHMYEKRRDQQRPQRSISQLSVKSQTSSFSFVGNQRFEYDQLDSGHDNVSESKRLLKNTAENSGCEKTIETKRKKKKKKKHLRKAVEPQTVPDSWADKKNSSPRKSEHSAEEHEEHDISECTHQMEDFDLTDVRKQLDSVATAKREADFQIKVMKIKAERLAKVCEGDSENGSFDNDNICPKDYLQSICYVKKHIVNQNNKLDLLEKEKQSYLNRLSSFAGAMLSDDNPNITDLNDPKRPTKLAEQLGSIYDNDWTDAMEMLEQSLPNTEENKEKCAHHLYCVIKVRENIEEQSQSNIQCIRRLVPSLSIIT
ncbi:Hypothetical predicted protein [Mytilus galloprovincialis]|uniref:Uncharacterized protein n=1 Tax=Mytilus galloprovincialis TaxID=29158 RepID=A0A8B6C7R2_MYTGA|nr:Hypothetical predicted protein [Mytilus galloprovincialis]